MKFEIKNRYTRNIIFEAEAESLKVAVEIAIDAEANLRGANLRWADLDFSAWPLKCSSFYVKADDRLVAQLFAHWARLDVSGCSPMVRYCHRIMCSMFKRYMTNLFCEYQNDVESI